MLYGEILLFASDLFVFATSQNLTVHSEIGEWKKENYRKKKVPSLHVTVSMSLCHALYGYLVIRYVINL